MEYKNFLFKLHSMFIQGARKKSEGTVLSTLQYYLLLTGSFGSRVVVPNPRFGGPPVFITIIGIRVIILHSCLCYTFPSRLRTSYYRLASTVDMGRIIMVVC